MCNFSRCTLTIFLMFVLAHAGAPLTTKEKDLLRYYYYIHNGIDTRFVASINQSWFKRIMTMVPRRLLRNQVKITLVQKNPIVSK